MPLRPIDAIFVYPKRRLYVVYYRGELWQLPRMKIDDMSWQHRQPYNGNLNALYISSHQAISDPVLAQKLRTLNLPPAIRGCTLLRFESWWETHGFEWLKDQLTMGLSPLAAHQMTTLAKTTGNQPASNANHKAAQPNDDNTSNDPITTPAATTDIFADMLADLVNEVMHQQL